MAGYSKDSFSTVFGNRRLDLLVFFALFLLTLGASRRLEVYSRMPAAERGPAFENSERGPAEPRRP